MGNENGGHMEQAVAHFSYCGQPPPRVQGWAPHVASSAPAPFGRGGRRERHLVGSAGILPASSAPARRRPGSSAARVRRRRHCPGGGSPALFRQLSRRVAVAEQMRREAGGGERVRRQPPLPRRREYAGDLVVSGCERGFEDGQQRGHARPDGPPDDPGLRASALMEAVCQYEVAHRRRDFRRPSPVAACGLVLRALIAAPSSATPLSGRGARPPGLRGDLQPFVICVTIGARLLPRS
jgi:hypothetical protein